MKRVLSVGGMMFVMGFAVAWIVKPEMNRAAAIRTVKPENSRGGPARKNPGPVRTSVSPQMKSCFEKLDAAVRSEKDYGKFSTAAEEIKKLPVSDIPRIIERMSRRAGFSGLDYREKSLINDLVKSWYEQEPQAALDWVAGMENVADRQKLMSEMIGKEAEKNFDHALELATRYGTKELGGLQMPNEIQHKLGNLGAERFFEVLRTFQTVSGSSGTSITFAGDFPFQKLADMVAGKSKEVELSFFPSNFLQEWTRRDPQGAWEWMLANNRSDSVPFNDPGDFFDAYRTGHSAEEVNALILDYMSRESDDETKYRFAWNSLASHVDRGQIQDFLARLPGSRSENLRKIVAISANGSGGTYDEFKEAICGLMSPQERLEVIPRALGESSRHDERYVQILKRLGHSDAEIQAMLQPRATK